MIERSKSELATIHIAILTNLRFEALGVAKPHLPFAGPGLDGQAARIDLRVIDYLAAEWTRPIELNVRLRAHDQTR